VIFLQNAGHGFCRKSFALMDGSSVGLGAGGAAKEERLGISSENSLGTIFTSTTGLVPSGARVRKWPNAMKDVRPEPLPESLPSRPQAKK